MKINILVEVFRGSEGRTAFVKKSKRGSASPAEVGDVGLPIGHAARGLSGHACMRICG